MLPPFEPHEACSFIFHFAPAVDNNGYLFSDVGMNMVRYCWNCAFGAQVVHAILSSRYFSRIGFLGGKPFVYLARLIVIEMGDHELKFEFSHRSLRFPG